MDKKNIVKMLSALETLEGQDFKDAVEGFASEIYVKHNLVQDKLSEAEEKIEELAEKLSGSETARLDGELSKAHKELADLRKKLGLKGDKDTQKTFYARNLLSEPNCLHFPGGRMLVIKPDEKKEISFMERNSDYYKNFEKMKFVETVNPDKK